jgi:hypothetical protein
MVADHHILDAYCDNSCKPQRRSEVWRSARALAAVEAGSLRIEGNDSGDKGGVFEKSISQMLCYTWLERLVVIRGL